MQDIAHRDHHGYGLQGDRETAEVGSREEGEALFIVEVVALDETHPIVFQETRLGEPRQRSLSLGGHMVGGQERIEAEVAGTLVSRLHMAALGLHQALALPLPADAQRPVRSAIDELDEAVHLIQAAALGADAGEQSDP